MADDIIQFSPGAKVTAEETNENNLLLKEWALDNSQSQTYINSKITELQNALNGQISSLNTQISKKANIASPTFTGTVKVPNSTTNGTAIAQAGVSKAGNGYLKMGNGIILQWGAIKHANNGDVQSTSITFKTPFSDTWSYQVAGSWTMMPKVGDKGFMWAVTSRSSSSMVIKHETAGSQAQAGDVYWIAIGF